MLIFFFFLKETFTYPKGFHLSRFYTQKSNANLSQRKQAKSTNQVFTAKTKLFFLRMDLFPRPNMLAEVKLRLIFFFCRTGN